MIATKIYKISRLNIDTQEYTQRFPREPHFVGWLIDRTQPYFNEGERLTAGEIAEIEHWPNTVNELFIGEESKAAKDRFLLCSRNAVEPETSTEGIIVKLVHQALAMGGLHCLKEQDERAVPQIPRDQPSNDIVDLIARPLQSFLLGVMSEMAERMENEWEANLSALNDDWEHDLMEARRETQELENKILDILYSERDHYARSKEEGWFYPDED